VGYRLHVGIDGSRDRETRESGTLNGSGHRQLVRVTDLRLRNPLSGSVGPGQEFSLTPAARHARRDALGAPDPRNPFAGKSVLALIATPGPGCLPLAGPRDANYQMIFKPGQESCGLLRLRRR
jgi:hypothetical protein